MVDDLGTDTMATPVDLDRDVTQTVVDPPIEQPDATFDPIVGREHSLVVRLRPRPDPRRGRPTRRPIGEPLGTHDVLDVQVLAGRLDPHLTLALRAQVAPAGRSEARCRIGRAALGFQREHRSEQERNPVVALRPDRGEYVGMLVEVGRRGVGGEIVGLTEDGHQRVDVGGDAGDLRAAKRSGQLSGSLGSGRCVRDHLRDQRVVVGGDLRAVAHTGVDADRTTGVRPVLSDRESTDAAGRRHPARRRVLGDDSHLDGVAGRPPCRPESIGSGSPAATTQLQLDEIEAGHRFGHRMLDLQAGVDLEEGDRRPSARHRP